MREDIQHEYVAGKGLGKVIPINDRYLHFHIPPIREKVRVKGKFFSVGKEKFFMKGVTYGAFEPDSAGVEYHDLDRIRSDFSMMAQHGFNTVRIPHTTPPPVLLDLAADAGLRVMIGLSAEQLVGYLIDKKKAPDLREYVKNKLRLIAGHPALLCIALGNEIPASIVRWIGKRKIEQYLREVYLLVKEFDKETPVTYVNYPTTEYLDLPFLDALCFNVYLEQPADFTAYIQKLQNMAADRPLIMGEIGLDCIRNSETKQAEFLRWQLPMAFGLGCAGVCIFSWTDEWFRGGEEVHDWAFGLTKKDRTPKPALQQLPALMRQLPFDKQLNWPMISVVICTYNGARTIAQTLEALTHSTYENAEVIVVNDGSTDHTADVLVGFNVQVISIPNKGLSHARNLGMQTARGEIVAYLDDDAYPDPDWLWYLAYTFSHQDVVGVGGPNLLPAGSNFIAHCVDQTPGTPTHILLSDTEAEHIPGCNMAFRKESLLQIGGFDTRFRVAGDDVDVCWRLQEAGGKIVYAAGAMVWHYRRDTIRRFWKQQEGYGKAEALLEKKWPNRFNAMGQLAWSGKIYGSGASGMHLFNRSRIYHGTWGLAPFQSIYQTTNASWLSISMMPEWYLVTAVLLLMGAIGLVCTSFYLFFIAAAVAAIMPVAQIAYTVYSIEWKGRHLFGQHARSRFVMLTLLLHALQPLARLRGRILFGLTPWRSVGHMGFSFPVTQCINKWCEHWVAPENRLQVIENNLQAKSKYVRRGGDYDSWDLTVKGGVWGMASLSMAAEDHAQGHQYIRFRLRPQIGKLFKVLAAMVSLLTLVAWSSHEMIPTLVLSAILFSMIVRVVLELSRAIYSLKQSLHDQPGLT